MNVCGLDIVIESPKGSIRHGKSWSQFMRDDYGYIANTIAVDGDELDCFIGPNLDSIDVYIIEQVDPVTRKFDEYKVMLGYDTRTQAYAAYHRNYQPGWKGFNNLIERDRFDFNEWYMKSLGFLYASA